MKSSNATFRINQCSIANHSLDFEILKPGIFKKGLFFASIFNENIIFKINQKFVFLIEFHSYCCKAMKIVYFPRHLKKIFGSFNFSHGFFLKSK